MMQSVDLQVKNEGDLSTFAALGMLFCFIFGFLITHEVSLQDSLKLCAILALDLVTGAVIWILFSRKGEYSVFELLGVGVALGTSLNAIGQLIFRKTIIGSLFNYLFLVFVVLLFIKFRRKNQFVLHFSPTRSSTVLAVCTTALILLCGDRYYLWVGVLVLALALFVLIKFEHTPSLNKFRYFFGVFSLGSIAMALFSSSILENSLFGPRTTTSYIGGWDGFYYEASSRSIMNFGPFDNIFLSNTKFAYYWFSDAWLGAFTQRSHAEAWVLTTQMGFVVCALLIAVFIYLIFEQFFKNLNAVYVSCSLVATTTIIGSPSFLINQGSFSYSVAVVWLIFFIFVLIKYFHSQSWYLQALSIYCVLLIVMTKTTIVAPIFGATSLCLPFLIVSKRNNSRNIQFTISIVVSSALSLFLYLIFIKATADNKGSYSDFNIELVDFLFGIGTRVILFDIFILIILKFGYLRMFSEMRQTNRVLKFLTISAFVSLGMSLMIRFQFSSANTFTATVFLVVTSLFMPLSINVEIDKRRSTQSLSSLAMFAAAILGVCSGLIATSALQYFNFIFQLEHELVIFASITPLIAVLFIIAFLRYKSPRLNKRYRYLIALIVLTTSMTGSYLAQSMRSAQQKFLYNKRNWDLPLEDSKFAIEKFEESSKFIRLNLSPKDIIASNSVTDKGLLAALTGIRNYGSSYFPNLWGGEEHRYIEQDVFAKDPSEKSYVDLRKGCVTWFYYDKDGSPGKAKSFEPYATTMYEDAYGAVLKLSESYPLPDECFK